MPSQILMMNQIWVKPMNKMVTSVDFVDGLLVIELDVWGSKIVLKIPLPPEVIQKIKEEA